MRVMLGGGRPHRSYVYHYLYLQLWLVYLSFVAGAFACLRIPDGRPWFFKTSAREGTDPAEVSEGK